MKTSISSLVKNSLRSLSVVSLFAAAVSCSEPEQLTEPSAQPVQEVAQEVATTGEGESASLTVAGAFVEYSDASLCTECTYIIPEDATIVDGAKVGIKPGDVICMNSAFEYKAIELVNVEGTESDPVIVATCNE